MCYDNCPKYIITRCPRDGNKNVFKVFWDIRFGKAVFLPIELFISDASPQGNSNDYYNLAWNFQADSILTKEKYGLPMATYIYDLDVCYDYENYAITCNSMDRYISKGNQINRLRVFKFYPEVYWYFLFNFDVEGYGRIVFNTSFSPTGDFLRMHLERPVYKSLVQL
ncbi:hypothetical protein HMI56_000137 [Coelomomyces lativittatus]|nr:hypothetical protein HMI56_000137 [Coelomomyces lativittatus]